MTLVKGDGTALAKAPGGTVLETVPEGDPKVKVLINVYRASVPDGTGYPAKRTQLAFRAGQVVSLAAWNREFPVPEITSVTPSSGSDDGGTTITIDGKNFTAASAPTVGGANATSIVVVNPTRIRCVTPAGTAGARDVVVATTGGSATKTGGFTYVA